MLQKMLSRKLLCLVVLLAMMQEACCLKRIFPGTEGTEWNMADEANYKKLEYTVKPQGAFERKPYQSSDEKIEKSWVPVKADEFAIDESDQIQIKVNGLSLDASDKCKIEIKASTQRPAERVYETKLAAGTTSEEGKKSPQTIECYVDVRNKGGNEVTYKIGQFDDEAEKVKFADSIQVNELYRFRVMAGPVYSTLNSRDKKYERITNSAGVSEIVSSRRNDMPGDFVIFLKTYLKKRDVLVDPLHFWERINPIIGVNLTNNPLQNFYLGLGFELPGITGVDFVTGMHWRKTDVLAGGYAEGQTNVPSIATKTQIIDGWFWGMSVDTGVFAAWMKSGLKTLLP